MRDPTYIPPLRFHFLTPSYDYVVGAFLRGPRWRGVLLREAEMLQPDSVLDVGCGTGTLAVALRRTLPNSSVVGVDADEAALRQARAKASGDGAIEFRRAAAQELPFADASFPLVVSSLFFHHLQTADKRRVLGEMRRVLEPDGLLLVADWGEPDTLVGRFGFALVRLLDGFETTADAVHGRLPALMREAGFGHVVEVAAVPTVLGTMKVWWGRTA